MQRAPALFLPAAIVIAACSNTPPPTQASPEGLAPPAQEAAPPPAPAPGAAHALVVQAAACWFGGMWSDAEGAETPADRRSSAEKRCVALVTRIYGADDRSKFDALRLADSVVVDKIAAEVDRLASADGQRKDALARLLRGVAAAQREVNDAHTAADAVKRDLKDHEEREVLTKDEVAAVKPLRAHAGLEALLKLDAGDLSAEAHAMGLLCAMDRMELARGLPKHLKVYAVSGAYQLVFGVAPPAVPEDATAKLKPGTWLGYLTDVARAAGHAVPDKATHPRERDPWAWGGVLAGFADRLRADAGKLEKGTSAAKAVASIAAKLDAEWAEIPSLAADQKTMAEREEKEREKDKAKGKKK